MEITDRQGQILNTIIEEYIIRAQPISSKFLEKRYNFGICPATIRIEMQKLTDQGYLWQRHTSAGRMPTDKAYRCFVDNLLEEKVSDFDEVFEIKKILRGEKGDIFNFAMDLAKFLATASSNFAVLHILRKNFFWKEGWEKLLKEPEFEDRKFISNFTKFLENFEKKIEELNINSEIKIYIGRENPFPRAKDFSIIISKCHLPQKEEGRLAILGPKRMAYQKNISLLNSLAEILENF